MTNTIKIWKDNSEYSITQYFDFNDTGLVSIYKDSVLLNNKKINKSYSDMEMFLRLREHMK